jgi:hypothetical protein
LLATCAWSPPLADPARYLHVVAPLRCVLLGVSSRHWLVENVLLLSWPLAGSKLVVLAVVLAVALVIDWLETWCLGCCCGHWLVRKLPCWLSSSGTAKLNMFLLPFQPDFFTHGGVRTSSASAPSFAGKAEACRWHAYCYQLVHIVLPADSMQAMARVF